MFSSLKVHNRGIHNSLQRIYAITIKELRQLSRDRPTFGMIVMIPLIQLLLFGFAIMGIAGVVYDAVLQKKPVQLPETPGRTYSSARLPIHVWISCERVKQRYSQ